MKKLLLFLAVLFIAACQRDEITLYNNYLSINDTIVSEIFRIEVWADSSISLYPDNGIIAFKPLSDTTATGYMEFDKVLYKYDTVLYMVTISPDRVYGYSSGIMAVYPFTGSYKHFEVKINLAK